MHKEFLKLLEKATGRSENVIAINLDIRSFTPFCKTVDSLRVAMYITRVYLKIIEDYFKNASFYKPTGDGLIIVIPYKRENLHEVANSTIETCLKLLQDFRSLCKDDSMINYPTPQEIGIGVARGSACCITSEDESKVLDYSGRLLNLASRLMELARPSGIVFDDSFQINILKDETKELFEEKTGYIRGVAEENPIRVYYTKKCTLLPKSFKQPIREPRWQNVTHTVSFKKFKLLIPNLTLYLPTKPLDEKQVTIRVSHLQIGEKGIVEGYLREQYFNLDDENIEYGLRGNKHFISFETEAFIKSFESLGLKDDMKITFEITYSTI